MRHFAFYLSVALLTFGIGSFVVFKFHIKPSEQTSIVEKVEIKVNTSEIKDDEVKYGCTEKEVEPFWEKLDKKIY